MSDPLIFRIIYDFRDYKKSVQSKITVDGHASQSGHGNKKNFAETQSTQRKKDRADIQALLCVFAGEMKAYFLKSADDRHKPSFRNDRTKKVQFMTVDKYMNNSRYAAGRRFRPRCHSCESRNLRKTWIPAFAGMTGA